MGEKRLFCLDCVILISIWTAFCDFDSINYGFCQIKGILIHIY